MNEADRNANRFERRWNYPGGIYINALVFPAVYFRARLFHSGDWHYPLEFFAYSGVMTFLIFSLRFAYKPRLNVSTRELLALQLRSGALVALPTAAYLLFFEYSSNESNLFGLCVVACGACLTFIIGSQTLKNPPTLPSGDSPLHRSSDMLMRRDEHPTTSI